VTSRMSFVDSDKMTAAVADNLEMFDTKETNFSIQRSYREAIRATNQFREDQGDLIFDMSADSGDYFLPYGTYITALIQPVQNVAANTALTQNDSLCFENDAGHTIFERCQVELGNQVVVSDMHYGYTNHKQALLAYANDANESHRTSTLYFKDTAGQMNQQYFTDTEIVNAALPHGVRYLTDNAEGVNYTQHQKDVRKALAGVYGLKVVKKNLNDGAQKRGAYTVGGEPIWVKIFLSCDFFKIRKYIPNGVPMRIRLTRAPAKFCLHCPKTVSDARQFKVLIKEPTLWVTKATVLPEIFNEQNETLLSRVAKYNIVRHTVKAIVIPSGTSFFSVDNVSVGQIPKRVVFGFVRNEAFDGNYQMNPFNYEHMYMQRLAIFIHGVSYPLQPFTPRYTDTPVDYSREYESIFDVHGIDGQKNAGFPITRDDYPNGYCLYGIDLTGDKSADNKAVISLKSTGNLRLEFQLTKATTNPYVCMFFAEYDHIIKIDGHRNVSTSYAL